MHFITSPVYSVDNLAVVAIFAAIGLAWRSEPVENDRAETAYRPEYRDLARLPAAGVALRAEPGGRASSLVRSPAPPLP